MESYNYSITPKIRDFIINNTKLDLVLSGNKIGYNHIVKPGASKRNISSDLAYYLLLSDLNNICKNINKYIKVDLTESRLCALISYFHSTNISPDDLFLAELNNGKYELFAEKIFLNVDARYREQYKENKSLRALEYKLWNEASGIYLNSRI